MRALRLGSALLLVGCGTLVTGCSQWGDYAEGSGCAPVLESLTKVISTELDVAREADSLALHPDGCQSPWSSEWVETELELGLDDHRRSAVREDLETTAQRQRSGVIITVEYVPGDFDVVASPGTLSPSSHPKG